MGDEPWIVSGSVTEADERRFAPATLRNREPILAVLREMLPAAGLVLELASGSGEHIVHFARQMPRLDWQPSDPSAEARQSIGAWAAAERLTNIREPLAIDAAAGSWPIADCAAILCINMIHISPWAATEGLMRGAGRVLAEGAPLYLYGPYRQAGMELASSNAAFDTDLRARDPRWGLRDLGEVAGAAKANALHLERVIQMPANNLSVIFRKS